MTHLERISSFWLTLAVGIAVVLSAASIFLLTTEFDEAWALLIIKNLVGTGPQMDLPNHGYTNGGVFLWVQAAILAFLGPELWAARSVSLLTLVSLLLLVVSRSQNRTNLTTRCLAVAPLLAVPGTVLFGGMAYSSLIAFTLAFAGIHCWETFPPRSRQRWMYTGLFFALAATTRINFVFIVPALAMLVVFDSESRRRNFPDLIAGACVGVVVAAALVALTMSFQSDVLQALIDTSKDTGALKQSDKINWDRLLDRTDLVNGYLPLWLMAGATLWAFNRGSIPARFFVLFGWIHLAFWLFVSPLPLLRYVWPTMAAFALVLGMTLVDVVRRFPAYMAVSVTLCAVALTSTLVKTGEILAIGDGNIVQAYGEGPRASRGDVRQREKQQVTFIRRHVAPDQEVGALYPNYQLAYRANRPVYSSWAWFNRAVNPKFLLVDEKHSLPDGMRDWLLQHGRVIASDSELTLYEVDQEAPRGLLVPE